MKKKECPACAMNIDETSSVCPVCGYEFPSKQRGLKTLAIALVLMFLFYILYFALR
jgi:hypothetical protein